MSKKAIVPEGRRRHRLHRWSSGCRRSTPRAGEWQGGPRGRVWSACRSNRFCCSTDPEAGAQGRRARGPAAPAGKAASSTGSPERTSRHRQIDLPTPPSGRRPAVPPLCRAPAGRRRDGPVRPVSWYKLPNVEWVADYCTPDGARGSSCAPARVRADALVRSGHHPHQVLVLGPFETSSANTSRRAMPSRSAVEALRHGLAEHGFYEVLDGQDITSSTDIKQAPGSVVPSDDKRAARSSVSATACLASLRGRRPRW